MTTEPIELPIPAIVGEPRVEHARCSTCDAEATATIEFVATHVGPDGEPRGCWAPAIYTCPAGHFTLESET